MYETKLTSKFQTTVPLVVRTFLGVKSGEDIEWRIEGNKVVVGKRQRFLNPLEIIKGMQINTKQSGIQLKKQAQKDLEKGFGKVAK